MKPTGFSLRRGIRRLGALGCACLLAALTGCDSRPLAERGIVQGVFLARQGGRCNAVIVYANAKSEQELDVAGAAGESLQQAFAGAVRAMEAEAYYGKTELLVIDSGCEYETAQQIKELMLRDLQPTPAIEVWQAALGPVFSTPENALPLYEGIQTLQKRFRVKSGLEKLGATSGSVLLPEAANDGERYTVNLLRADAPTLRLGDPLTAQLAACLNGQGRMLAVELPGQFWVQARVWPVYQSGNKVTLAMYEDEWKPYAGQSEEEMRRTLKAALKTAYAELLKRTGFPQSDPLGLRFAQKCEGNPAAARPPEPPVLEVRF